MFKKVLLIILGLFPAFAVGADGISRNVPIKENTVTSGSPHAWALATTGLITERNGDRHDTLSGKTIIDTTNIIKTMQLLGDGWDINDRNGLLESLDWLKNAGHRKEFQEIGIGISSLTEEQLYTLLKNIDDYEDYQKIIFVDKNYKKLFGKSLLGWDYGRYIALCRWGYLVGFLSEEEAWGKIMPIAKIIQQTFNSWQDFEENYLIGREFWSPEEMNKEGLLLRNAYQNLLNNPTSPWKSCAWDRKLEE